MPRLEIAEGNAIRAAQAILQASTPSMKIDGHWGKFTSSAYSKAGVQAQQRVKAILLAAGSPEPDVLSARHRIAKTTSAVPALYGASRASARAERYAIGITGQQYERAGSLISPSVLRGIIQKASEATGVKEEVLLKFVDLEAARKIVDGQRMYVADAVNPNGYRGLGQFDGRGSAWAEASKFIALPPFESSWRNPFYNVLAAAAYVQMNISVLRRLGYTGEVTAPIAYLMHNQGAKGAYDIMSGRKKLLGNQSADAVEVARLAILDAGRRLV